MIIITQSEYFKQSEARFIIFITIISEVGFFLKEDADRTSKLLGIFLKVSIKTVMIF